MKEGGGGGHSHWTMSTTEGLKDSRREKRAGERETTTNSKHWFTTSFLQGKGRGVNEGRGGHSHWTLSTIEGLEDSRREKQAGKRDYSSAWGGGGG